MSFSLILSCPLLKDALELIAAQRVSLEAVAVCMPSLGSRGAVEPDLAPDGVSCRPGLLYGYGRLVLSRCGLFWCYLQWKACKTEVHVSTGCAAVQPLTGHLADGGPGAAGCGFERLV